MRRLLSLVMVLLAILAVTGIAASGRASAVEPEEVLADPALEKRARVLSAELRCLVCQNQSIDDSNAPLAKDLRLVVRERLQAGDSDRQIVEYIVARYGEFVLLRPRFNAATLVLWLAPLLLLAFGIWLAWRLMRRADIPHLRPAELSAEDRARLARMLDDHPNGS